MERALNLSTYVDIKERIPYAYEFICLSHAIIAFGYEDLKDLLNTVKYLKSALQMNGKTLQNQETLIRGLYFISNLMRISLLQKNYAAADSFAMNILKKGKKLTGENKYIEYLIKILDVFMETKNVRLIQNTYKILLKEIEKPKGDKELKKTKAYVYQEYAKYLYGVVKKKSKSNTYKQKAIEIYKDLNLESAIPELEEEYKEIDRKLGKKDD